MKMHLQSRDLGKTEAEEVMGEAVGKAWRLVNLPVPAGVPWRPAMEHGRRSTCL